MKRDRREGRKGREEREVKRARRDRRDRRERREILVKEGQSSRMSKNNAFERTFPYLYPLHPVPLTLD